MHKKSKKSGFFLKLAMGLAIFIAFVCGAYFALDKLIVPKYFKDYGINGMRDLVSVVSTLYSQPKEKEIITNGFTPLDRQVAVEKLLEIGFPENSSGNEVDYAKVASASGFEIQAGEYLFTDRQVASIVDDMLKAGVLATKLPDLKFIDTNNITILQFIISPVLVGEHNGQKVYSSEKADINLTFKFDTSAIRSQMAEAMDTPIFLLNMILPETLYITTNYSLKINDQGEWETFGNIGLNGRNAEDSQILLNLLIDFIFPADDNMTLDKLTTECGNILLQGIGLLGDLKFTTNINNAGINGVVITMR